MITLGFLFVESHNISDFPFLWKNSEFQRQMKNMCERYIQRVGRILEKESRDSIRSSSFVNFEAQHQSENIRLLDTNRIQSFPLCNGLRARIVIKMIQTKSQECQDECVGQNNHSVMWPFLDQ